MNARIRSLLLALPLVACAASRSAPSPAPTPAAVAQSATPEEHLRAPVRLTWETLQRDDHHAVLRAHIAWNSPIELPLTLTVTLPGGVRLTRGSPTLTLQGFAQRPTQTVDHELAWDRTPDTDAALSLDGASEAMGVHATAMFRFGRPEPLAPQPTPAGPAVVVGGRNFGSAVPATP